MRISIRSENKRGFFLILPTSLFTNPISMHFIKKYVKIDGLNPAHIKQLVKELKNFKRYNGRFELVNIESHDGTNIKITI
jgi:hypothetical protein